ncbi:MAG TPA: diacylglycerol kinase family protein [Acidobacteriota bacterium]|jgi:YegS/Rv2252/BmrU family lipid kinase
MQTVVIINPVSGGQAHGSSPALQIALASSILQRHGLEFDVRVTEGPGHAYEIAGQSVAGGASLVFAWGGDGTVNEVGSALTFQKAALGIIPAGSGNGLARELGISRKPDVAIESALNGTVKTIDVGEINGLLFINVAGVGFDAHIASLFGSGGAKRRGFRNYLRLGIGEICVYKSRPYRISFDSETIESRALLVAVANSRQWGNGAQIAPLARIDDGLLDLVVVEDRSVARRFLTAPRLFTGTLLGAAGVHHRKTASLTIFSDEPVIFHVDGEPKAPANKLTAGIHLKALKVRVPKST